MTQTEKTFHIENHTKCAESHAKLAECMGKSADGHTALAEHTSITDPSGSAQHRAIAACHKAAAESHVDAAQHHLDCAKALGAMTETADGPAEKAQASEIQLLLAGLNKLLSGTVVPSQISSVPRIMPRYGQRDMSALSKIDEKLAPIFDDNQALT